LVAARLLRQVRQSGELLEELQRLEHEIARAVSPGGLQREHDAAIDQEAEPILGHRRAEQIATELFQAGAIQKPRPLQENGTSRSNAQSVHRRRAKP
jgi:hypothetical protein